MNASDPTPPSGENVSGESVSKLKCRQCGFEWPYTGPFLQEVWCPGCASEGSALDLRTYYLMRVDEYATQVEVTVPPEIASLAEIHKKVYGTDPEDLYHDLLDPQLSFVEEGSE